MKRNGIKNACYVAGMAFGMFMACASGARAADICSHLDTLRMTERVMPDSEQVKPLLDVPLKDPSICKGPDGLYLNKTFYVGYSVYGSKPGGYLLRSASGKAEGPYEPVAGEHWCQPSFFQDDDDRIYYSSNNQIVPWKPDMTGPLDKKVRYKVWSADGTSNIGDCSGSMVKIGGKYVFCTCGQDGFSHVWNSMSDPGSYLWNYMVSDSLQGPWTREQVIGPHTGHGGLVQDRFGHWWATSFFCEGSQAQPCLSASTAYIAPCTVTMVNGIPRIRLADSFPDYVEKALRTKESTR